ncbi:MAG TPA: L,D-transpeptidase family protein, partial [Fibrobacteria bacterium]|nr:L,D-transpeptidase family protein [Fibrobacteria bacterium]
GWPAVPKGGILALGDTGSRVTSLCRRLALSGDLKAWDPEACGRSFDSSLVAAVKRFQGRHGLAATGRVDEATLRDLNVTVEDRIDQIRLGLECWRWLPRDLGERHVRVNIADFSLTAWKGDKVELAMRVVVGRKEDSTPVFSDRIVSVSLNPPWNIPESIAKEEILPELKADPTYLERQGMELLTSWSERGVALRPDTIDWSEVTPETFRFRIRQKHGEGSALGKVKFVMTNPFNIYLHDTPSKAYFAGHRRALSHGCVRVERPVELAEWILAPDWNRESLLKEIAKGEPTILPAPGKGMPVHILYWTAFIDAEGGIQFRRDIYGWGRRMERDLQRTARR